MTSADFEIRWINESKGYGVFASQDIPPGTRIYQERAVMHNIDDLIDVIGFWRSIDTLDLALHKTKKETLETSTSNILQGMNELHDSTRATAGSEAALQIHDDRLIAGAFRQDSIAENSTVTDSLWMSMDLYKITGNSAVTQSENEAASTLEPALLKINTYLNGSVGVHTPSLHAWGLNTALINHGCRPTALVTCSRTPEQCNSTNVGIISLHSVQEIKQGQEITIEYALPFGSIEQRQGELRYFGIPKCLCVTCEEDANVKELAQLADNTDAQRRWQAKCHTNSSLRMALTTSLPKAYKKPPVPFFHIIHQTIMLMMEDDYFGQMYARPYEVAIGYAKHHNDNVRVAWIADQLEHYVKRVYGGDHPVCMEVERDQEAARAGMLWNTLPQLVELKTLAAGTANDADDERLVFMLDHEVDSHTYHLLAVNREGRLYPITRAANLTLVQQAPSSVGGQRQEEEDTAVAAVAADTAAAELAAAEDEEAAKKERKAEKAKSKKSRQREKKKAASLAAATAAAVAATAIADRLAARVAAVRSATMQPALPLAFSRRSSPPLRTPRFRSRTNSCPEWATIERFLRGSPLREPPEAFREVDCISEGEREYRFGVRI